jgi:hypothetical protein
VLLIVAMLLLTVVTSVGLRYVTLGSILVTLFVTLRSEWSVA